LAKRYNKAKYKLKPQTKKWLRLLLIVLSPILLYTCYYAYKEFKAGLIKYKAFGIYIPDHYEVHGIDVSRYQQIINWKSVKDMNIEGVSIDFAFLKATQGTQTIDLQYFQNRIRARKADVPVGAYHFFVASKDPVQQADLFSKVVQIKRGDLPPVVDIEKEYHQSSVKIRKNLKTWLRLIERRYEVKPIIYTNVDFYKNHLEGYFDSYPVWIAHYTKLREPNINKAWTFWQLSEEATVNGIKGKVDFNVFNGSKEEFEELKIK
jgi:lysozyme